jgi:hypothetical protein
MGKQINEKQYIVDSKNKSRTRSLDMKKTVYRVLTGAESRIKMYELNNNKLLSRVLS